MYLIIVILISSSCQKFTQLEEDSSAGINGSFEIWKNDLPVNWLMYTPSTVPDANFEIVMDNHQSKEGNYSLRFDVTSCSSIGGWRSPGFTSEFFSVNRFKGEQSYKISFWVKNEGAEFKISAGPVSTKEGNMQVLISSNQNIPDWKYYEYIVNIVSEQWLRMELNILSQGSFWIDDININTVL
jgi:hypothetical protein